MHALETVSYVQIDTLETMIIPTIAFFYIIHKVDIRRVLFVPHDQVITINSPK